MEAFPYYIVRFKPIKFISLLLKKKCFHTT